MLMIFKTNDLLRGIESTLNTRWNARSFITMSECCIRALHKHKRKKCHGAILCLFRVTIQEQYALLMLTIYKWCLWIGATKTAVNLQKWLRKSFVQKARQKFAVKRRSDLSVLDKIESSVVL